MMFSPQDPMMSRLPWPLPSPWGTHLLSLFSDDKMFLTPCPGTGTKVSKMDSVPLFLLYTGPTETHLEGDSKPPCSVLGGPASRGWPREYSEYCARCPEAAGRQGTNRLIFLQASLDGTNSAGPQQTWVNTEMCVRLETNAPWSAKGGRVNNSIFWGLLGGADSRRSPWGGPPTEAYVWHQDPSPKAFFARITFLRSVFSLGGFGQGCCFDPPGSLREGSSSKASAAVCGRSSMLMAGAAPW